MSNLIYPTLDLFAYDLIKGLGINSPKIQEVHQQFWVRLPHHIKESLTQVYVLDRSDNQIKFGGKIEDYSVDGSYNCFSLGDTQAFLFDRSLTNQASQTLIDYLPKLKSLAPAFPSTDLTLGQTWMISGWISSTNSADLEVLAEKLYQDLIGQDWQHQQVGEFLGGTVFEVWRSPRIWDKPEENSHALIIFYPDQQKMEAAGKFYRDWLHLLCYRHKIWFSYAYSRQLKQQLQTDFNQVVPDLQNRYQYDLGKLKTALDNNLDTFSSYGTNLNLLAIQQQTITSNLYNYQSYLNRIEARAKKTAATDLNFLKEFSGTVEHQYQKQIAQDFASFSPGLGVLQGLTETIRGIVEVEQAQRDRNFQTLVGVAGTGIATASLIASVSGSVAGEIQKSPPIKTVIAPFHLTDAWATFFIALTLSIIAGGLVSLLTWIGIVLVYRGSRRPHSTK